MCIRDRVRKLLQGAEPVSHLHGVFLPILGKITRRHGEVFPRQDGGNGLLGDEAGKVSLVPGGLPGAIQLGGLLAKLLFPRRQSRRSLAQR